MKEVLELNKETIALGKKYECQPVGLQRTVIGEVVKKMDNCVVICVEKYDGVDYDTIMEKFGKVVAKYSEIKAPVVADCFFS